MDILKFDQIFSDEELLEVRMYFSASRYQRLESFTGYIPVVCHKECRPVNTSKGDFAFIEKLTSVTSRIRTAKFCTDVMDTDLTLMLIARAKRVNLYLNEYEMLKVDYE